MSDQYFFRNDDVRDRLDKSLLQIQDIFLSKQVPITHAVEPANLTKPVIEWLLKIKILYPELVTIMQHGYDHTIKNNRKKGEFGGQRGFSEQYSEIKKGKELMEHHFGGCWFEAFNFPYAPYNESAIQALEKIGFKVLNSHYNVEWKRQIFYSIGHFLNRGLLFNRHVSWNFQKYPNTSMTEISMNITFIKKYNNEDTDCDFFSYDEIISQINKYIQSPFPIGLLLHHRYHTKEEHFILLEKILDFLEKKKIIATSMEQIYNDLQNKNKR